MGTGAKKNPERLNKWLKWRWVCVNSGPWEKRNAVLRHDHAADIENAAARRVEGLIKQHPARANRVRRVDNDDIEPKLRFPDEVDTIADDQLCSRILKRATANQRQVFAAQAHDFPVDVDENHTVDGMLENLFEQAAVSAADDQNGRHRPVPDYRHMTKHLVVVELVGFGRLHDAIEYENAPEVFVFEYQDILIAGPALIYDLVDTEGLSDRRVKGFVKPIRQTVKPLLCSVTCT